MNPEANRRNAQLSTGPATDAGKAISSRNAIAHGLTAQNSVMPGESPEEYLHYFENTIRYYRFAGSPDPEREELAAELADLRWRLRRVPRYEARVIALEMRDLSNDPEHAERIEGLELPDLEALAWKRLIERKVLTNLYHQEARLNRRADRILKVLASSTAEAQVTTPSSRPSQPQSKSQPLAEPPAPVAQTSHAIRKNEPTSHVKVGRNEPCPCGSHLKFKRCCGNPLGVRQSNRASAAA